MQAIYFFLLLALISGAVLPIQAGLNVKMGRVVGDPIYAALISFVVGSIGLFGYVLLTHVNLSQIREASQAHWTVWLAGLLGAFYVAAVIILVPKIGAALTFGLVVAGQLSVSLLLDHYGFLGLPIHPLSIFRILGIVLIIVGVILIRNF